MTDKLTRAGWPRPIVDGWPVPWVSPADDLANMHQPRADACASGCICAVCGCDYAEDDEAYVLVKATEIPADMAAVDVEAMDNGVLHKHCLRLALARCPELRRLHDEGTLQIVRTKANIGRMIMKEDGRAQAVVDGAECVVISKDDLK